MSGKNALKGKQCKRMKATDGTTELCPTCLTGNYVQYIFKLADSQIRSVIKAFKEIQDISCVMFVERRNQKDFIHIMTGESCYSDVGKLNIGEQDFSLNADCFKTSTVVHELMHSLGFIHEHTRCDRDIYVNINITNIKTGFVKANFEKRNCKNVETFNQPYDYNSIMHYKGHEFAINPMYPTIYKIDDPHYVLGNERLSMLDIRKLNLAYKCK